MVFLRAVFLCEQARFSVGLNTMKCILISISYFKRIVSLINIKRLKSPIGYSNLLISKNGDVYIKKTMEKVNKILTQNDGYHFIVLNDNGKNECVLVHRLLALAYIPNPDNKPQVNHIDGNKHNNDLDNLEWVTASENMKHAYALGLNKGRKGIYKEPIYAHNPKTGDEIILYSTSDAKKNGFNISSVKSCADRYMYRHKGYVFRWASDI